MRIIKIEKIENPNTETTSNYLIRCELNSKNELELNSVEDFIKAVYKLENLKLNSDTVYRKLARYYEMKGSFKGITIEYFNKKHNFKYEGYFYQSLNEFIKVWNKKNRTNITYWQYQNQQRKLKYKFSGDKLVKEILQALS